MKIVKLNSRNRRSKSFLPPPAAIKLDIGCGSNKKPGFVGCDQIAFPGVDLVGCLNRPGKWVLHKFNPSVEGRYEKASEVSHWPTLSSWGSCANHPFVLLDNSVEEANCSHCLEHFTGEERVQFFNELYRVMQPGAKCTIITPHWASCRAYGDPTHKWPPVSEFLWYYLKRDWRLSQAPHTDVQHWPGGFSCNFEVTWGYGLEPGVAARNQEYQQMAMQYYKEACTDMMATLTKC